MVYQQITLQSLDFSTEGYCYPMVFIIVLPNTRPISGQNDIPSPWFIDVMPNTSPISIQSPILLLCRFVNVFAPHSPGFVPGFGDSDSGRYT